jgi:hypothetical protein
MQPPSQNVQTDNKEKRNIVNFGENENQPS